MQSWSNGSEVTDLSLTQQTTKTSSNMKLFLLFPMLSMLVSFVDGLKCYCNDANNCDQGLCSTDGTCRTWVRREKDGGVKRGYQCIDKDKLFPPERPFACENSDAIRHRQEQNLSRYIFVSITSIERSR